MFAYETKNDTEFQSVMRGMGVTVALPLAYITSRYAFAGSSIVQVLGFLPLIMPPFVGAVALQLLFGERRAVPCLFIERRMIAQEEEDVGNGR